MTWVVDASVAIKWVIPEVLTEEADRLWGGDDEMLAPDLLLVEVANVLWRKMANREISPQEADRAFTLLSESGIDLRQTAPLLPRAMQVARRLHHPVYDCVYLALAEREQATFVTADRRLLRRVSAGPHVAVADLRTI